MIHLFECQACGGQYFETSPNGVPYEHVCGLLPAGKNNPARKRPNARDENHDVSEEGKLLTIRSEGAGVKCLSDTKVKEPRWISRLKLHIAKREEKENA